MTFEVQTGKRYNRRDGEISGVIGSAFDFDLYDRINGRAYHPNGRHLLNIAAYDLISEYVEQEPTAAPVTDEWGPWIGWNGGECPVEERATIVEVVWLNQNGSVSTENGDDCELQSYWEVDALPKIIAYRIKKEPEVYERSFWVHDGRKRCKQAIITTQGDKINARWAE